ncbi:IS630 transposase-related protein [Parathermosynechococcus lividus]
MPRHSLDLRLRVVAASQAGGTSIQQVTSWFKRGQRTTYQWVQRDLTRKPLIYCVTMMSGSSPLKKVGTQRKAAALVFWSVGRATC